MMGERKSAVIAALVFAAVCAALPARAEDDIIALISQYRREHGLKPVTVDAKLTAVAERQAKAMASSGIMDHDVAGSFHTRIAGSGTDSAGENIAAGTKTWPDTLRMWEHSPGHNQNLLLGDADIIGVAVSRNENTRYKVFWAMVIGHKSTGKVRGGRVIAGTGGAPQTASDSPSWGAPANGPGVMDSLGSAWHSFTSSIRNLAN
jgi:hypothetical protein